MHHRKLWYLAPLAAAWATFGNLGNAAACDDQFPERYRSELTVWCVYEPAWVDHQADIEGFFPFGDDAVLKLIELFQVDPRELPSAPQFPYTIEVGQSDGIAHTPSNFGPGVRVTGDAFWNEFGGVQGYWGYLLTLHEFVNQWTGLVSGGWPTDWWADHRSPFPNAMDYVIFDELGYPDVANAHRERFIVPGSSGYDEQVVLFGETIFNLPGFGFEGYSRSFAMIQADQMKWNKLRDPPAYQEQTAFGSGNPSGLLSEYIIAYLSLGAAADLTAEFVAAGVGEEPANWTDPPWQVYTPASLAVGDIADAHCSLAAAGAAITRDGDAAAQTALSMAQEAFWMGDTLNANGVIPNYPGVCGADCPSDCGCNSVTDRCVAPWRGDTPNPGAGGATAGGASAGGMSTAGSAGAIAAAGTGGAPGAAGASMEPSAAGSNSTPPATAGNAAGGMPNVDPGVAGGPNGSADPETATDGGCGCNVPGQSGTLAHGIGLAALFALGGVRRRHAVRIVGV